jgi:hypothetical protein
MTSAPGTPECWPAPDPWPECIQKWGTPSALAMRIYFAGPGRKQEGSAFDPAAGVIWYRALGCGHWYADRACAAAPPPPPLPARLLKAWGHKARSKTRKAWVSPRGE